jgi:mannose-6-phosphate isomerase-like protein (cupin superfamily)
MPFVRGRLSPPSEAPPTGEIIERLADVDHAAVDQILSGRLDEPVDYCQDESEWVLLLHGEATLDVEDVRLQLGAGDWVLLPARTPHRLVETRRGTSWLTVTSPDRVHLEGDEKPPGGE